MRTLLLTLFLVISFSAVASILPENNRAIPVSEKSDGLSDLQYYAIIDRVESVYRPIVQSLGMKLTINRMWSDSRVNAGTTKKGNEIIIYLYGGYARHPLVTEDGYALVICHELGHHLGGTPKKVEAPWATNEGQADYFATLKCLRKVFRQDDNVQYVTQLKVPEAITEKCKVSFKTNWEIALCQRTSVAGLSVGAISSDIRNTEVPTIETPDHTVVAETYDAHPEPQCRLDTYFQGSVCEVSSQHSVSLTDESEGVCHEMNGQTLGVRPACWFKSTHAGRKPYP